MSGNCASVVDSAGTGVSAALQAVDCEASQITAQTFGRLFEEGGALAPVLTILLVLYVGFFAVSLMIGRSSLSVRALTPRMLTIGLVLTFATSFAAYQSVFWNIFIGGPDWLAGVLTDSEGSATIVFAQKLDLVFLAVQNASSAEGNIDAFSPPGMMWMGALLLLLGTVGILVTARIGLALLLAIGPIFVVMGLFNGTRGLFTGWLKGLVMLALTPVFAVLGGSIMLELAVPVLSALAQFEGEIEPQAAMAFFLIGAVHCALMFMVFKVASTMVAGWQVFGLLPEKDSAGSNQAGMPNFASNFQREPAGNSATGQRGAPISTAAAAGLAGSRQIDMSAMATAAPANDAGGLGGSTGGNRVTNVFATSSGDGQMRSSGSGSRTRGIGSRFRAVSPSGGRAARKPSPSSEKN